MKVGEVRCSKMEDSLLEVVEGEVMIMRVSISLDKGCLSNIDYVIVH